MLREENKTCKMPWPRCLSSWLFMVIVCFPDILWLVCVPRRITNLTTWPLLWHSLHSSRFSLWQWEQDSFSFKHNVDISYQLKERFCGSTNSSGEWWLCELQRRNLIRESNVRRALNVVTHFRKISQTQYKSVTQIHQSTKKAFP